jgi:small subunit ribosomal protein S17
MTELNAQTISSPKEEQFRKTKVGTVVSDKMNKTITVEVERLVLHPTFQKYYKRRKKFKAHDEKEQCGIGDVVEIIETRPLSKTKRWAVKKIIQKALAG